MRELTDETLSYEPNAAKHRARNMRGQVMAKIRRRAYPLSSHFKKARVGAQYGVRGLIQKKPPEEKKK